MRGFTEGLSVLHTHVLPFEALLREYITQVPGLTRPFNDRNRLTEGKQGVGNKVCLGQWSDMYVARIHCPYFLYLTVT